MNWRATLGAFMLLLIAGRAQAAAPPSSCGVTDLPEAAPAIAVWQERELALANWQPPGCSGWPWLVAQHRVPRDAALPSFLTSWCSRSPGRSCSHPAHPAHLLAGDRVDL